MYIYKYIYMNIYIYIWLCAINRISRRRQVPRFTERVWRKLAKAKFEIGGFWYLWPVPPAPGCGHGGGHGRCPGHAGRFKCPKKRPGEASAKPLRDSCEPRPQIGENLDYVFMASHKQVFRLRETTTSRRLEFLLNSGPQKRSSRARKTPTFRKMEKT